MNRPDQEDDTGLFKQLRYDYRRLRAIIMQQRPRRLPVWCLQFSIKFQGQPDISRFETTPSSHGISNRGSVHYSPSAYEAELATLTELLRLSHQIANLLVDVSINDRYTDDNLKEVTQIGVWLTGLGELLKERAQQHNDAED